MSKEIWMAVHEEMIAEYQDEHPEADWSEAYHNTADAVSYRYRDRFADMIDAARDRAKEARA